MVGDPERRSDEPATVATLAAELVDGTPTVDHEGAGWDHVAWRVTGDDGVPWIVRTAGSDEADGVEDPPAGVRREVAVMADARAALADVVPDAVVLAADPAWMAYRRLPGVPLQDLLARGEVPDVAVARLAHEIGGLIRVLGKVPPPPDVPVDDGLAVWLAELPPIAGAVRDVLPPEVHTEVDRFLAAPPPAAPPREALWFAHNDLGAEHVLVDPASCAITGIIDWSDAAIADPAADVGRLIRDLGGRHVDAVLDGLQVAPADRAALLARAWCYARCLILEDLAYAIERRPDLIAFEQANVTRLFLGG